MDVFFIVVVLVIAIAALIDYLINYSELNSCPKCTSGPLKIGKIGDEPFDNDIHDVNTRFKRQIYKCKNCGYRWSKISEDDHDAF